MEVKTVGINSIKPYENNPRINDGAVEATANSIKEFGWQQPIVVDKDGVIIVGHTRLKAAKKLGLNQVPVVYADKLTDAQVKAYRLADNKTGELADWDFDLLDVELDDLDLNFDMSDFGFELSESEADDTESAVEDDFDEYPPSEPKSKLGQIYKLGRHRLMCGDSTDVAQVTDLLGGVQADLLITDPPYNVAYSDKDYGRDKASKTRTNNQIANDKMNANDFYNFLDNVFNSASNNMKSGAPFYVWFSESEVINVLSSLESNDLSVRETLIWVKNNFVLSRQDYHHKHEPCLYGWKNGSPHPWYSDRKQTTILEFDKPLASELHPTMKPIPLFDYQIRNSSKTGDNVLDLFGGSGTTIMACEQNGRNAYLMEYDPRYVDVIIKRWEEFTGEKAELIKNTD